MARALSFAEQQRGRSRFGTVFEHTRELLGRFPESGAIFGFVSVLLFFTIATWIDTGWPPQILDLRSIASIMTQAASLGVIAVGVTVLMISGEFDLSVGSILGLSALIFIVALDSGPDGLVRVMPFIGPDVADALNLPDNGMSGIPSILVALFTGGLLGLINGLLLVITRIPSFIVTLGTLYIYRSIMLNIIPGGTIARYGRDPIIWSVNAILMLALVVVAIVAFVYFLWPTLRRRWSTLQTANGTALAPLVSLGIIVAVMIAALVIGALIIIGYSGSIDGLDSTIQAYFFDILDGKLDFVDQNFRSSIIWWFLIAAIFWVILGHTRYGNAVFATGGNPEAARAQGVNARRVKVTNFVISGMLAAVGGIMEVGRFKVVEPLRGTGYELDAIAAVVIGGTLLTGGYGSVVGSVIGILIAFTLKTGTVLIGIKAEWFRGVLGIIMIGAVIINTNIRRQR